MRKSFLPLFVTILLLVFTSLSQVNLDQPIPVDPNVRIGKLPNGLAYYIRKNAKPEHKVELRLAVNAGSILERDDQQGLAHFMEHMNFNGTSHFKKNELVSYLQSIGVRFGADINAYTSFDETVYMLSIPTEKKELIDKGLLILADWASESTLDQGEIDKERGVVLEELRLGRGADQRMRDKYFPKLFEGSQYALRIPIGQKTILEKFGRKSLLDFYETWYRPDLMAVVVVGDLDVNEIEAKIKAEFSGIKAKRKPVARPSFPIPDTKGTLVDVETDKEASFTSAEVIYKNPVDKIKTQKDLRQQLAKDFYNGMLGARLVEISQSPNPPFLFASVGFSSLFRDKGAYEMFGGTNPQGIKATISTMLSENRRVQEFGFTKAEFDRQKERYLSNLENRYKEREKSESSGFADEYVYNYLSQDPIPGLEFTYQFGKSVLPTITLDEVNALAKNTTTKDNRAIIITGSEKSDVKYPSNDEILALIRDSESAPLKPYSETVSSEPLVKDLPANAKVVAENFDKSFGITTWTLSNGVKVVIKPTDFKEDEILMRGFSPGGLSLVGDDKALSGDSFSGFVSEAGLKNLSRVQLNKILAGKKASASLSLVNEFEYVNGSATPKDFETMLQLAYLKFTSVDFNPAEFDSFISKQKMFLPNMIARPQSYFGNEVSKIMSQNHPRVFGIPTVEQLEKVKMEDMQAIYKDRYADASDFTFIFVGNVNIEKAKPLILTYLGNLPSTKRVETWKDLGIRPPSGKLDKTIYKGVDHKSQVQIVYTATTPFSLDERYNLAVLSELLTIKLTEILREEKGGVYGVNASGTMSRIPYERYTFTISFPCGPENVNSLIDAAMGEVAKIQNGQIEDKDIAKVKEARSVKLKEDNKRNDFWYLEITRSLLQGIPLLSFDESENKISAISKADIQSIAKKYLIQDKRLQFVLMPEGKK